MYTVDMFYDEHTKELNCLYDTTIEYFEYKQINLQLTLEAFILRMYLSYIKR